MTVYFDEARKNAAYDPEDPRTWPVNALERILRAIDALEDTVDPFAQDDATTSTRPVSLLP